MRLHGCPIKLENTIAAGVRPHNRRMWQDSYLHVHYKWLHQVIGWARDQGINDINWSELPESWQMLAAGGALFEKDIQEFDPYAVLHLKSTAPFNVVKAAYKALVKDCHPDHGGDVEEFKKISNAYENIQKILK